jgi:hypothetical protein
MAKSRKQRAKSAILPLFAPRSHSRSCERFGSINLTPDEQQEIAELAFSFWLARGFRSGSPQEDWIEALRQTVGQSSKSASEECVTAR